MGSPSRAPAVARLRPVDIPALTGLRAFAALAVVAYHLRGLTASIAPAGSAARPLLEGGMLGVDVFFVLSGFVIAHTYAHRLADPAPRARRGYLVARVARVYPLHLVTFLAVVVLVVTGTIGSREAGAEFTPFGFVGNLLMLQALPGIPAWNLPAWSISCELAAYLAFPLFAARLLRIRWGTALALALAVLSLQLATLDALSSTDLALQSLYWTRIAGEFTAGALLWVVWSRVLRTGLWGDVVVGLCTLGSVWLLWSGHSWLLVVPLLVAVIPAAACATGPVATLLTHPLAQWGGRISYALYLVHGLVVTVILAWVLPDAVFVHPDNGLAAVVIIGIVVTMLAAAALLHHGVEEPARRWLRRRFAPSQPERRDAVSARETVTRSDTSAGDRPDGDLPGRATIGP